MSHRTVLLSKSDIDKIQKGGYVRIETPGGYVYLILEQETPK